LDFQGISVSAISTSALQNLSAVFGGQSEDHIFVLGQRRSDAVRDVFSARSRSLSHVGRGSVATFPCGSAEHMN
jgi:hypothetical protein